jgi:pimeloyl-ACP methyl ester carboxylesterase
MEPKLTWLSQLSPLCNRRTSIQTTLLANNEYYRQAPLAMVGFSLGACITLNWAVHKAALLGNRVKACVAVSPPLNMNEGAKALRPGTVWLSLGISGLIGCKITYVLTCFWSFYSTRHLRSYGLLSVT